ncbi:MAG: ABC transporter substrate-binding protein, partial [Burkholderiaceae bacterium]
MSQWETSRRLFLQALGAAFGGRASVASAQVRARAHIPRIGLLAAGSASLHIDKDPEQGVFVGLRELGYVEGQNIVLEWRYAEGKPERLAILAAELVRLRVDAILAQGPAPRLAASKATSRIPIIAVAGADPVREGWARSLAHPGGNMTGLTVTYPELDSKRLEIIKQAFPDVVRMAVLLSPNELPIAKEMARDLESSARQLGMQMEVLEVRAPDDLQTAFV